MHSPVWIFGYGSLVWRPSFPYAEQRRALVRGFERRFWQGSTDHRGVPGTPGRVVTLIENGDARCVGVAYGLEDASQGSVLEDLDHRERGGYLQRRVELEFTEGDSVEGLLYLATPDNPNYLGVASLAEIAAQVRASSGPSGSNAEYVVRLASALRELDAQDAHVFELEAELAKAAN